MLDILFWIRLLGWVIAEWIITNIQIQFTVVCTTQNFPAQNSTNKKVNCKSRKKNFNCSMQISGTSRKNESRK